MAGDDACLNREIGLSAALLLMAYPLCRPVTAVLGLALCAGVQPARAQLPPAADSGVTQLERIEVTAQKRTQTLQEVPIAITAYTGAFLENAGIAEFKDLAPFVPGLFVQEQSPNFPGINLRGITTDDNDPRADARVSIFQDGMSISRATGSVVEFFDMERVEVLKGPQGTLFGRSAEIGAISLLSRRPVNATEASLTAGAGNFSARRLAGHYNTPLVSGKLLGRVAFAAVKRDGNQANLVDGSDLNGRDTVAVRPTLRWAPQAGTTVDVIVNYQHDRPPGTGFKSTVIPTSRGDTDPFTAAELTRGSALGVVLGALIIQMISSGIVILGIDQNYSQIIIGSVVIAAVVLDNLNTWLAKRRLTAAAH